MKKKSIQKKRRLLTSRVCIRFGLMASFIKTVKAPVTPYRREKDNKLARGSRAMLICPLSPILFLGGHPPSWPGTWDCWFCPCLVHPSLANPKSPAWPKQVGIKTDKDGEMVTKHISYVLVAARYRPVMNTKEDIQKQQGLCRRQWGMQNSSEPQLCTSVRRRSLLSKWTPSSPGSPRDTHQVLSCHRLPIFVTGHHHPS